jgi:hypothetical protein
MKYAGMLFILFGVAVIGLGQNASSSKTSRMHFRWSQRNAHELNYSQTIGTSKELDVSERASLTEAIAAQIRPFKADLDIDTESELQRIAIKTRVMFTDLNSDGIDEILAQAADFKAGCGATGNCPFWVFQKTSAGLRKVLDTRGQDGVGGIQVITISANRTNGFKDLVLGTHDSVAERTLLVYRYNQEEYKNSECYKATWIGPNLSELKNPAIFRCRE